MLLFQYQELTFDNAPDRVSREREQPPENAH